MTGSQGARIVMAPAAGGVAGAPTSGGAVISMGAIDLNQVFPEVGGSMNSIRGEIDDAFADMKTCFQREPDESMRMCMGHSARLSEIRVRIQRIEDFHRQWKGVRTREVEPAIAELANQFTIASRLHSVRELDWKMEQGER